MKKVFLTLILCGCINYLFAQNSGNQSQLSPYEIGIQNAVENGQIENGPQGLGEWNEKPKQYQEPRLRTITSLYVEIENDPPRKQNFNSYLVRYNFKAIQVDKFLERKGIKITDVKVEELNNGKYNLYYRKAKSKQR